LAEKTALNKYRFGKERNNDKNWPKKNGQKKNRLKHWPAALASP
jgi:hypothetical protein